MLLCNEEIIGSVWNVFFSFFQWVTLNVQLNRKFGCFAYLIPNFVILQYTFPLNFLSLLLKITCERNVVLFTINPYSMFFDDIFLIIEVLK